MREAPDVTPSEAARDVGRLPPGPRWLFLQWAAEQGLLLHGSKRGDLTRYEPRSPVDLGPDEFSKRTGVFAASDGLWAMMYALTDRSRVKRLLNMAQQIQERGSWSRTKYFLSFAPHNPEERDGCALMSPGFVYLLPSGGFEQAPPFEWPGLGWVQEAQWVNPVSVQPLMCVPIRPDDFPLPARTHRAEHVDPLSESERPFRLSLAGGVGRQRLARPAPNTTEGRTRLLRCGPLGRSRK